MMFEPNPGRAAKLGSHLISGPNITMVREDARESVYVLLGANGDLCSMLPAFKKISSTRRGGKPVKVVVAKQYAPLLEGVTYVHPIKFPGHYKDCVRASNGTGIKELGNLVIVQAYGNPAPWVTPSFVEEMWNHVGLKDEWDNHPLLFDRRSQEREEALLRSVNPNGAPMILVGTRAVSAPLKKADELLRKIRQRFQDHVVVDLGRVEADRVFDMIGLYDAADALVSIDTVHLHLSRASSVPVIALANDGVNVFSGCPNYSNQVGHFWYRDYELSVEDILDRVDGAIYESIPRPHFYHVHSEYPRKGGSLARHQVARKTWETYYQDGNWTEIMAPDAAFHRNSKTLARDTRVLPLVGDVIDFCADRVRNLDDLIVLTNDDTCFAPALKEQLERAVLQNRPAFAHRWDFLTVGPVLKPVKYQSDLKNTKWYPGSDLFVFSKRWWMRHRVDFPQLIMACEFWDCILRQMIKRSGGLELKQVIYHWWHDSLWQQPGFRENNPGQKWNIAHAKDWFTSHRSSEDDCYRRTWFDPSKAPPRK